MLCLTMEHHPISTHSVNRSILSSLHTFRYLTASTKKKRRTVYCSAHVNNFTRGQKKYESLSSGRPSVYMKRHNNIERERENKKK